MAEAEDQSPAQIKDKETTYFSFLRSKRSFQLFMHRKVPWGLKSEGCHPIIGGVKLSKVSVLESILAKRCTRTGEDAELYQIWTESQAEQDDWPGETQKKCPI